MAKKGKKNQKGKKGGGFMRIFKLMFSILFLLITILWVLFTVSFIGVYNDGWEWATQIPFISELNSWLTNFINSHGNGALKQNGIYMILIGGAILLSYVTIFYPIQKIPFFGKLLKWLTGIIPAISGLSIIIGIILVWAI